MAYSSTNPPVLLTPGSFGGQATRLWGYRSTHNSSQAAASGFITDGYQRGMRVGDCVQQLQISTASTFMGFAFGAVSVASTAGAVTLTFAATST